MNYVKHLNGFFDLAAKDNRLNPYHISLYLALFQLWNEYHFPEKMSFSRNEIMALSKIRAISTYQKHISELHDFGYIVFELNQNPLSKSLVSISETYSEKEQLHQDVAVSYSESEQQNECCRSETSSDFELLDEPYINVINNTNNKLSVYGLPRKSTFEEVKFLRWVAERKKLRHKNSFAELKFLSDKIKLITHASPFSKLLQNIFNYKFLQIPGCGGPRSFVDRNVFPGCHSALETRCSSIQHLQNCLDLTIVHFTAVFVQKLHLFHCPPDQIFGFGDSICNHIGKIKNPVANLKTPLCIFQMVVVCFFIFFDHS